MLRQSLLWLSRQNGIFHFISSNRLARHFASRFVAGETIEQGVAAAKELKARGIGTSLDLLGESVTQAAEAVAAKDQYLLMLDRLATSGADVNVSVKLTQMGFDIDEDLCGRNMLEILDRARAVGGFVRLDMESSAYTQRTLDFFYHRLFPTHGAHCGVVIQSALRRSEADVDELIERKARVRLCKGAYLEPPAVAFADKADVDRNYVILMERLLLKGNYPGIATHDEAIISQARKFVQLHDIPSTRFEFQMLYGVRPQLQLDLVRRGYKVLVATPYGPEWYPYLMRRLGERPANALFFVRNLVRR